MSAPIDKASPPAAVMPCDMDSFRDLLVEVSARLAGHEARTADAVINETLAQLGEAVAADRAFVLRFDLAASTFSDAYEWDAPGFHSQLDYLANLPMRVFAWSADRLLHNEPAVINRLDDFPLVAGSERALCEQEGIRSVLYVPMSWNGEVIGCLGFAAIRSQRTWNDACVALLRIVGNAIASVLHRQRTERLLETLVQAAPDIRVLIDTEHRILLASNTLLQRLGRTMDQVRGVPAYTLFPPGVAATRRAQVDQAIATNQPVEFEDEYQGRFWRNLVTPLCQPGETQPSMLAVHTREVTEERKLQRELLHASAQALEQMVRTLHDTLAQQLVGVRYLTSALARQATDGNHPLLPQIQQIHAQVSEAVTQMRDILNSQMSLDDSPPDFTRAVHRLAEETTRVYGVRCDVAAPAALDIPDKHVRNELHLIAREAVGNAARHAQGGHIAIVLRQDEAGGLLQIRDDGVGTTQLTDEAGHFGLRIMRIRASSIGGSLEIDAAAGRGTTVTCRFPLPRQGRAS